MIDDGMALPADYDTLRPDCGVVAVAVIAGISYAKARELLAAEGKRDGRWRGGTSLAQREAVLRRLGFTLHTVKVPRMRLETWALSRWARPEDQQQRYMVRVRGHVMLQQGLAVLDQRGRNNVFKHWARRKIVTHVFVVTREASTCA
jgi:hypothetical protein